MFADERVREALRAIVAGGGGGGQRRMIEVRHGEQDGGGILRFGVRLAPPRGPGRRWSRSKMSPSSASPTRHELVRRAGDRRAAHAHSRTCALCLEAASEAEDASPEVLREHFNRLNIETRRLERMIGEMLSLTEIEAGSLR